MNRESACFRLERNLISMAHDFHAKHGTIFLMLLPAASIASGTAKIQTRWKTSKTAVLLVLGLLVKINVGLVVVVFQKISGAFVQTHPAGRAGRVHGPRTGNVFGLKFACFIGHESLTQTNRRREQCAS